MTRYFVPPSGVQRQQATKTVSQAQAHDRQTGTSGIAKLTPRGFRSPDSPVPIKAATNSEHLGRSRTVLDSLNVPAARSSRSAIGGGAPLGIPRFQRAVSNQGGGPSGNRPRAQNTNSFSRTGLKPPIHMPMSVVKKASGHAPRITPAAHFGAKVAVREAQQKKPSIYGDSPLGQNSPSFVRSSGGFRPPQSPGDAQAQVSVIGRGAPTGAVVDAALSKPHKRVSSVSMLGKGSVRPPNQGVKNSTGARTMMASTGAQSFRTQTPEATAKLATMSRPLPIKPGTPGSPGRNQ